MTPDQAFIAEYQQTIIDLGNRLAQHASLIATLQNQVASLTGELKKLKEPSGGPSIPQPTDTQANADKR